MIKHEYRRRHRRGVPDTARASTLGGVQQKIGREEAGQVVSIEIDQHLHQLAKEELFGRDNVTLLRQDALKNKNRISPAVLDQVDELLATSWSTDDDPAGRRFKLVANLLLAVFERIALQGGAFDILKLNLDAARRAGGEVEAQLAAFELQGARQ